MDTISQVAWSTFKFSPSMPFRDLANGNWQPSDERRKDADIYRTRDCRVDYSDGAENHDLGKENQQRLSDVNAWEWVPQDGLPLIEWDPKAFIERAIQNRFGVMIVGDSLSANTWIAWSRLITPPHAKGVPLVRQELVYDVVETKRFPNETNHYLSPQHPFYNELRQKYPHIPEERFKRPIIHGIRNDMITVGKAEMAQLVHDAGYNKTIRPLPRLSADWRSKFDEYVEYGGWKGELPGIVIINTGAHWNQEYTGIPEEYLFRSYVRLVELARDALSRYSQVMPMRSFWRSMSPAHAGCKDLKHPVHLGDPATLPVKHRASWHMFADYNKIATEILPPMSQSTLKQLTYWDIWNMSLMRPDAHVGYSPGTIDCVHWCSPSVPEWWVRTLWHTIVEHKW
ncbi:hypothetical protein FRB99_008110 [Tulasnella sp. 403]|nr:hypothetical protein FRB99_008110 [Tulasnella sp. 403]